MSKNRTGKRTIVVRAANIEFLPPQPIIIGTKDVLPKGTDAIMHLHEDDLDLWVSLTMSDVEGLISDLVGVRQWLEDRLAGRVNLPTPFLKQTDYQQ